MVPSYPIPALFDSGTLYYCISYSSLASHSNLICIDAPWDQYRELGSHHLYNQIDYITTLEAMV